MKNHILYWLIINMWKEKKSPVGKVAEKAVCKSVFLTIFDGILSTEINKNALLQRCFCGDFAYWVCEKKGKKRGLYLFHQRICICPHCSSKRIKTCIDTGKLMSLCRLSNRNFFFRIPHLCIGFVWRFPTWSYFGWDSPWNVALEPCDNHF